MNHTPTYRVVNVTPELAGKWLAYNTRNRNLTEKKVAAYAGAMERGEWRENGAAICFSSSPKVLLDGQQRLAAITQSGVTIRLLVAEGLDPESQLTIDTGRKRSFGDNLKMAGEGDYSSLAALVGKVYRWQTGQMRSINRPATYDQLLAILDAHPELRESVTVARSVRRQLPVSASILGLCHWLLDAIATDDADFFFDRLRDGQGLIDGDPIFTLRKLVLNSLVAARGRGRMDDVLLTAVIIKTWNAYRRGEQMKALAWRAGGAKPEAFPVPE